MIIHRYDRLSCADRLQIYLGLAHYDLFNSILASPSSILFSFVSSSLFNSCPTSIPTAGSDYIALFDFQFTMTRDQTTATIPVRVLRDALNESEEHFTATLSLVSPSSPRLFVSQNTTNVLIQNTQDYNCMYCGLVCFAKFFDHYYSTNTICRFLHIHRLYTVSLFEKLMNQHRWYSSSALVVWLRYGRVTVAVLSRFGRGAVEVRLCYGRGAVEVRLWCGRDALPLRSPVQFRFGAVL